MTALAAEPYVDPEDQKVESGLTVDEVTNFAKGVILNYFKDKSYYGGGRIPPHLLVARKRVNFVLDCTFDEAMYIAHEAIYDNLSAEERDALEEGAAVSPEIKTLIWVLKDMSHAKVPQELSNGMLILYLELCMGADVVYA